jgi:Zn-dependent metalloprotease
MNKKLIATLVMSSVLASAFAVNAGAANDKKIEKDEKGAIHNVVGKLGKVEGKTAEDKAIAALEKVKGDFGFAEAKGNFKVKKSKTDELGVTHTKLDRTIEGIRVVGNQFITHEKAGEVQGVTGTFSNVIPNAEIADITTAAAIEKAVAHTGFQGELVKDATSELVYLPKGEEAVLSYEVKVVHMGEKPGSWTIYVNAVDGSIVDAINEIEFVAGSGVGVLGDTKTVETTLTSGVYYLEDRSKAMTGIIRTRDYRNGTATSYNMTDSDNVWNTTAQRAGVDAHVYAGKVFDFFKNNYNRNSINNAGMTINSYVHYSRNYNNAFWNGSSMTYGDGDGSLMIALSGGLDIVAHELMHGVTDFESDLVYQNQSGALNESWSDAFGAVLDSNDWTMGEDVYTPGTAGDAFRDMQDPTRYNDPAHMSQYINTTEDNGGVHSNSGIPNKAFYNLATALGSRQVAANIWYKANCDYMTSSTNFSGARSATLQAASVLYGASSTQYNAVANAWSAVGVY